MSETMLGVDELVDPRDDLGDGSTGASSPSCSNGSNSCDDAPRVRWQR